MGDASPSRMSALAKQRNILVVLCGSLAFALVLNGAWSRACTSRVVLVPTLTQEATVASNGTASNSYLSDMARFITDRLYNRSPANAELANAELLRVAHSEQYGRLREQFESEGRDSRLGERDVSTTHFPERVEVDPADQSVAVITTVNTYVGDKRVSQERMRVVLSFKADGGEPRWIGLREEPI